MIDTDSVLSGQVICMATPMVLRSNRRLFYDRYDRKRGVSELERVAEVPLTTGDSSDDESGHVVFTADNSAAPRIRRRGVPQGQVPRKRALPAPATSAEDTLADLLELKPLPLRDNRSGVSDLLGEVLGFETSPTLAPGANPPAGEPLPPIPGEIPMAASVSAHSLEGLN
jgi:hypothetical protein